VSRPWSRNRGGDNLSPPRTLAATPMPADAGGRDQLRRRGCGNSFLALDVVADAIVADQFRERLELRRQEREVWAGLVLVLACQVPTPGCKFRIRGKSFDLTDETPSPLERKREFAQAL